MFYVLLIPKWLKECKSQNLWVSVAKCNTIFLAYVVFLSYNWLFFSYKSWFFFKKCSLTTLLVLHYFPSFRFMFKQLRIKNKVLSATCGFSLKICVNWYNHWRGNFLDFLFPWWQNEKLFVIWINKLTLH